MSDCSNSRDILNQPDRPLNEESRDACLSESDILNIDEVSNYERDTVPEIGLKQKVSLSKLPDSEDKKKNKLFEEHVNGRQCHEEILYREFKNSSPPKLINEESPGSSNECKVLEEEYSKKDSLSNIDMPRQDESEKDESNDESGPCQVVNPQPLKIGTDYILLCTILNSLRSLFTLSKKNAKCQRDLLTIDKTSNFPSSTQEKYLTTHQNSFELHADLIQNTSREEMKFEHIWMCYCLDCKKSTIAKESHYILKASSSFEITSDENEKRLNKNRCQWCKSTNVKGQNVYDATSTKCLVVQIPVCQTKMEFKQALLQFSEKLDIMEQTFVLKIASVYKVDVPRRGFYSTWIKSSEKWLRHDKDVESSNFENNDHILLFYEKTSVDNITSIVPESCRKDEADPRPTCSGDQTADPYKNKIHKSFQDSADATFTPPVQPSTPKSIEVSECLEVVPNGSKQIISPPNFVGTLNNIWEKYKAYPRNDFVHYVINLKHRGTNENGKHRGIDVMYEENELNGTIYFYKTIKEGNHTFKYPLTTKEDIRKYKDAKRNKEKYKNNNTKIESLNKMTEVSIKNCLNRINQYIIDIADLSECHDEKAVLEKLLSFLHEKVSLPKEVEISKEFGNQTSSKNKEKMQIREKKFFELNKQEREKLEELNEDLNEIHSIIEHLKKVEREKERERKRKYDGNIEVVMTKKSSKLFENVSPSISYPQSNVQVGEYYQMDERRQGRMLGPEYSNFHRLNNYENTHELNSTNSQWYGPDDPFPEDFLESSRSLDSAQDLDYENQFLNNTELIQL